jgi:hypothetical protein
MENAKMKNPPFKKGDEVTMEGATRTRKVFDVCHAGKGLTGEDHYDVILEGGCVAPHYMLIPV